MRITRIPFHLLLGLASFSVVLWGCDSSNEPQGPEMGSVQAYLDEHPEEAVDVYEDDAESEEQEFAAAEDE